MFKLLSVVFLCALLLCCVIFPAHAATTTPTYSIGSYQLVGSTQISRTIYEYSYKATLTNAGSVAVVSAVATLTSNTASTTVKQGNLNFGAVTAGGSVVSTDTFTIRQDRTVPINWSLLVWSIQVKAAPVANAGPNQLVNVATMVTLNGSASTDPNGLPLAYAWSFLSRPPGSTAALSNPTLVNPTFLADEIGDYQLQLVVSDATPLSSAPSTVTIGTQAVPPTANAGADQTFKAGSVVHLDGSKSSTLNGGVLAFAWQFTGKPPGSTAVLSDSTAVKPTFTADKVGDYFVQLIVTDVLSSPPSSVKITSNDVAPVAVATATPALVPVATIVTLDGTGSTDADGDPLTYAWLLTTVPPGSTAALSSTTAPKPTFTVDLYGTYVAQLTVSDGFLTNSTTVTVSTENLPPTADAGPAQLVNVGALVTLDGSKSKDHDGLALTYSWIFTGKPAQSAAALTGAATANPSFTVDKAGNYVAQLTVGDSLNPVGSTPASVTISTNNIPPVANPGPNQNVQTGATVTLDGSGSTGTSGYALTYSWSLTSIPPGSTASLTNATSAHPSFVADVSGTYIAQLIVNDNVQDSAPKTVTITAANGQSITINLNSSTSLTFATVGGSVHTSVPAGTAGIPVTLGSDNTAAATVPGSVTVLSGTQDVSFTVTTGSGTGMATITGSSAGFVSGSSGLTVNARGGSVTLFQPLIGAGRSFGGTITLNDPAPTNGATLTPSTDNAAAATVSGSAVINAGQTTGNFTVTGGSTAGTAHIGVSTAGYSITPAPVTLTGAAITLASGVTVAPGSNATLNVTLSQPAPAGGVTVALSASPAGTITVPSTVSVGPGKTAPDTQPQVTGVALGSAQVTATAPGYAPDTETVTVQTALTLSTVNLQVLTDNTADITVTSTSPAGQAGLLVTVLIDDTSKATAPATVQIQPNQNSATITVTGVAVGSTTLHVSAPGATGNSATVTVSQAPAMTLSGGNPTIGKDLQIQTRVNLGAAAPPGNILLTIASDDPTKVLLSISPTGDAAAGAAGGSASIGLPMSQNATLSAPFYVQGLVSSGSTTLAITMPGYAKLISTVTLTPSGFTIGPATFTTQTFADSTLTVYSFRLNANLSTAQNQALRPGAAPVDVTVTSSDTSVGTVASPATFTANATQVDVNFHGVNGGASTVSVSHPSGFSTPSTGTSAVGTVTAATITAPASMEIGKGLQDTTHIFLNTAAPVATTMTIGSNTPNLVFSRSAATAGFQSLDTNLTQGQKGNEAVHNDGTVYVQALTDTGTATVTVHAIGYTDATFAVTFRGAGIALLIGGQGIAGRAFTNNPLTSQTSFSVQPGKVAADGTWIAGQMLGPAPLTVTLTTTDAAIGAAPATAQIAAGSTNTSNLAFTPGGKVGTVTIGVTQPTGFVIPNSGGASPVSYATATGTITASSVTVNPAAQTIGLNLQSSVTFTLPQQVPAGSAITVTIASSDPNVVISTSKNVLGTQALNPITINPGSSAIGTFYVQVIGQPAGTVSITATASKYYSVGTETVTVGLSGIIVGSAANCNSRTLTTTTLSPDSTPYVCSATLNASSPHKDGNGQIIGYDWQASMNLRPGISLGINLTNSDPTIGTAPASVTFNGGDPYEPWTFHPLAAGTTVVSLTQPPGFNSVYWVGAEIDRLTVNVTAPVITASNYNVGFDLQQLAGISLQTAIPSGGRTATITSDNSNLLVYNGSATPQTGTSIQIPLAANATAFNLTYQALAGSGTANVTIAIPGFATKTVVITLVPAGFYFSGGAAVTLHPGGQQVVNVYSAALDPKTGNILTAQSIRAGSANQSVGVVSGNTDAATVAPASLTFGPGTSYQGFTITGVAVGTSVLTLTQPTGFTTPNQDKAVTVTVN